MPSAIFSTPNVAIAIASSAARAQQPFGTGPYDPAVPTPRSVLGYEVGDRFTPHHLLSRYIERVAAASRRLHVDTVAVTFEGREVFLIVDGADDDWASWYAQWLIELSELPDLLGARPVRSELIYLLVSLDKQYTAEGPGEPWETYYAGRILRHFRPAGS